MRKKIVFCVWISAMFLFICFGYAALSDQLTIRGSANVTLPDLPDVYIKEITPNTNEGVTINATSGTTFFCKRKWKR